ncbi:MAG: CoA transferase [Bacteroidetes bacterium]|nr:MAG: CoA transferase [Bacteroidota bacterium]
MTDYFRDLKVVELASVLAGPAVSMFFAELGATVIKVENKKTGGDMTRKWKLPGEDPASPWSAYYHAVNYRKQTVFADLTDENERREIRRLIAGADIVISNFRPRSAQKLGMDYPTLKALNPTLIYAQITGFGDEDRPAFDVVLQAEAGFLHMTGEPDRPPVKMPVALIDLMAAHQLKEGILVALLRRGRTGEGAFVSASLLESAVASLANQATNWLMAGHIPARMGCAHPNIAPYGDIFYTKDDKSLVLAVGTDTHFRALCDLLGCPDLATDPDFQTNPARVENRQKLYERLAPFFRRFDRDPLLEQCHQKGIPAGSIRNMKEVFDLPLAKAMILEEKLPDGSLSKRVKTVAFSLK